MDEISRKLRSIDWKSLQKSARKVQASTASALKDMVMTDLENKTRSATADTSWGASVTDLHQIARGTYNPQDYVLIMSIIWQRLGSSRWRCVYKGLEVLKYVIMHGSSRCLTEARGAISHLEVLREYRKISEGRDVGEGVRTRAALVCDMLSDDELLEAEKEKSREIRAKIESSGGGGSISSDQYRYGGMGSTTGTNVSTTATATFKGYDDDEAYDEQPSGAFSKLRIEEKKEVDLLGDDDQLAAAANKVYDDDDDDAFDPRGTANSTASQPKEEDDLLALALSGPDVAAPPHPPATNGALKTSELVQQLAAQRTLAVVPAQQTTSSEVDLFASAPHAENSHSPPAPGTASQAFNGFGADTTQAEVKRPAPVPVKLQRKEDADPFGDLLDTAKKSGVV